MRFAALNSEERTALAVAIILHVLLVAALLLQPDHGQVVPVPERMTVSLAKDVGLEATAPAITSAPRAAVAPVLADMPAPPEQSAPQPVPKPAAAQPVPKPAVKAIAKPADKPVTRPAKKQGGASRIGDNFLEGAETGRRTGDDRVPASQIGASEKASLRQAIARQLKPHWSSPQGADAELLVTIVAFDLNPDGTLSGAPRVVGQDGITDSNRPQAGRHAELAMRAVQLAAPFDLPPKLYNAWKSVKGVKFDRNLLQ